jgi:hypothetical protein
MAPKNRKGDATATPADLSSGQYDSIMAKLAILDTLIDLPAKMSSLEKLLQEANSKIAAQQAKILNKDKAISDLKVKVNSLEQYNRKWSVRINNLPLPDSDETDTTKVIDTVYSKALLPILEVALSSGLIRKIPEAHELLR